MSTELEIVAWDWRDGKGQRKELIGLPPEMDEQAKYCRGLGWTPHALTPHAPAAQRIAELERALAEAERDARRWRTLNGLDWYVGPSPEGDTAGVSWHDKHDHEGQLAAALDALAAMQKEG